MPETLAYIPTGSDKCCRCYIPSTLYQTALFLWRLSRLLYCKSLAPTPDFFSASRGLIGVCDCLANYILAIRYVPGRASSCYPDDEPMSSKYDEPRASQHEGEHPSKWADYKVFS